MGFLPVKPSSRVLPSPPQSTRFLEKILETRRTSAPHDERGEAAGRLRALGATMRQAGLVVGSNVLDHCGLV